MAYFSTELESVDEFDTVMTHLDNIGYDSSNLKTWIGANHDGVSYYWMRSGTPVDSSMTANPTLGSFRHCLKVGTSSGASQHGIMYTSDKNELKPALCEEFP